MSKKHHKDKLRADVKHTRKQRHHRKARAATTRANLRKENKRKVDEMLTSIMNCNSGLDAVLDQYDRIKNAPERVGLCHDLAVAIIHDLHQRGIGDGWTWCTGPVDGGIKHSWVEYGGWCVDMGDDDELRVWSMDAPEFKVDCPPERRSAIQAIAWAEEQEVRAPARSTEMATLSTRRGGPFEPGEAISVVGAGALSGKLPSVRSTEHERRTLGAAEDVGQMANESNQGSSSS